MVQGLSNIADGSLSFNNIISSQGHYVACELVQGNDERDRLHKPIAVLIGDLAFEAVILGKEGYSPHWSNFCDLHPNDWRENVNYGTIWTVTSLTAQAQLNVTLNSIGIEMKGVKSTQFTSSENIKVLWLALHGQIGIGNLMITYMFDTIDQDVEKYQNKNLHHESQCRTEFVA